MSDEEKRIYEFHFKVDAQMKIDLESTDEYKKSGNLSGLIVKILESLCGKMENKHFFGEQKNSAYEFINEDFAVKRESVHVYLPAALYRKLKLMHNNLNFYSIAQLLREVLGVYVGLDRVHKEGVDDHIKELAAGWEKENSVKKLEGSKLRQLSQLLEGKHENLVLMSIYDIGFSPAHIYRL